MRSGKNRDWSSPTPSIWVPQPWPFPASLMVGFRAQVDPTHSTEVTPDGTEIVDLRWFSREELRASLGEVMLPGRPSIARAMIEEWMGEALPDHE